MSFYQASKFHSHDRGQAAAFGRTSSDAAFGEQTARSIGWVSRVLDFGCLGVELAGNKTCTACSFLGQMLTTFYIHTIFFPFSFTIPSHSWDNFEKPEAQPSSRNDFRFWQNVEDKNFVSAPIYQSIFCLPHEENEDIAKIQWQTSRGSLMALKMLGKFRDKSAKTVVSMWRSWNRISTVGIRSPALHILSQLVLQQNRKLCT